MITYFELGKDNSPIFFSNVPKILDLTGFSRLSHSNDEWKLSLITNEHDLVKSRRLFKKLSILTIELFSSIFHVNKERLDEDYHTLEKIHTKLSQKIEQIFNRTSAKLRDKYSNQKSEIIDYVNKNPEIIAGELLYLRKRVFELGAHMLSSRINGNPEGVPLNFLDHNMHDLLLNIWLSFEEDANNLGVVCDWRIGRPYAEEHKIRLDYSTFNVAMFNFFDNLVKYAKPGSNFSISFNTFEDNTFKIIVTMLSLRIEKEENDKIFQYGIRGIHCSKEKFPQGNGIGLFTIKKALSLNRINLTVDPNYSISDIDNNVKYVQNTFIFKGQYS